MKTPFLKNWGFFFSEESGKKELSICFIFTSEKRPLVFDIFETTRRFSFS